MDISQRKSERIENLGFVGQEQPGAISDFSATGLCLVEKARRAENSFVTLQLNDMTLKAKVMHCAQRSDGFRQGLQFWDIPLELRGKLDILADAFSKGVPVTCTIVGNTSEKGSG